MSLLSYLLDPIIAGTIYGTSVGIMANGKNCIAKPLSTSVDIALNSSLYSFCFLGISKVLLPEQNKAIAGLLLGVSVYNIYRLVKKNMSMEDIKEDKEEIKEEDIKEEEIKEKIN